MCRCPERDASRRRRSPQLPRRAGRLGLALLVAALATATIACQPAAPTKATPVPGRIAATGDSITLQAALYGGDLTGVDTAAKVGLGWEARHAQPRVTADVSGPATSPATLIVAFGQNYGDRFGQEESNQLTSLIFTPDASACVGVLLPHAGRTPSIYDDWQTHRANVTRVRQDLTTIAQARQAQGSPTVVVDWSAVIDTHPEYLDADGVHLSPTDADGNGLWDSAEAYLGLIWSGVAQCQAAGS